MERVAIESRAIIVKLLQNLEKELVAKVADGVTDWSKARIDKQLKEANAVIKQYYDDAAGISKDTTTSVAQVSASATTDSLLMAVGNQVTMAAIPTASYLETLAGNTIIQGAVQSAWWSRQSEDTAFKFQSAVRQGLVGAETSPQIIKRVRSVLDISKRNAETLVHTSVQSVANATREKIFDDNNDIMSGKEWSAALDRLTCPTCGALDGKRWTTDGKPIGHSMVYQIPPKHFRCRCSMIPVLKTWKELGINMDELSDNTRASMEGQVNDKTFADWLKRKTETDPTFADRTLGKGRAELWRNNKITMDQMISGGKPLSLAELKAKYDKPILDQMKNNAYEIAKSGGRNKGFFNQWDKQKKGKIEKSIKSLLTQVDIHNEKIDNPKNNINKSISDHELNYLVTIYWPKEIRNFKQQIDILEGILGERHHVKK
jgi:SPP1 gp7 family putative phage head morphogenesis protein